MRTFGIVAEGGTPSGAERLLREILFLPGRQLFLEPLPLQCAAICVVSHPWGGRKVLPAICVERNLYRLRVNIFHGSSST